VSFVVKGFCFSRFRAITTMSAIPRDLIYTCWFRKRRPAVLTNRPQLASKLLNRNTLNMKILVCMKQVPQKDAPLKLNESGTWIRDDVSYEVNEPDAFALEEALRQKEKHTGEVVVITAGPARSQQVLREGLAKGADRAIHLEDNGFVGLDAFNMAKAFVAAIKDEKFDLIFTGLQSDDYGYAQTGVIMAELLGWPHATIIMEIQKADGGIKVKRELESGFFQHVSMPLPAVLTIQSGINKLRYATLLGIKQAKNKPLRKVTLDEVKSSLGEWAHTKPDFGLVGLENMQKIEKLYVPQKTKKTEMLEGSPGEVAKKLVDKLRNDVRVI
jgi:electron transfer flavoprotein beta subunit